ncbi:hypothetical protein [Anaerovorax sp. IOR16]|uniref:hypothetical protein n=1 Tax=Anaerovorax sp. IOR16 TaxID=2773458 RepID=UPI0019D10C7F|nr:hypothetical protein [Anaerovorax sp. IOR16]
MNYDKQAIKVISNIIIEVIKEYESSYKYDKTVRGIIKQINSDSTCDVEIQGRVYTSLPSLFDTNYTVNQPVWVTIPCNNWRDMFILGRRG